MLKSVEKNLERLIKSGQSSLLSQLGHGIEKEGLRVDAQGSIAQTSHPASLGSTLTHPEITTDYSEALLEFITGVNTQVSSTLDELADLHRFTYLHLGKEELWAGSMPCSIESEAAIRIAEYGNSNIGQLKHIYRVGLQYRYGKMMQTIAGIHYNFSLPENFWSAWKEINQSNLSEQALASRGYFSLIRNFRRYSWLLLYLFGASPVVGKDFLQGAPHQLDILEPDTLYLPWATSLRMSDLGYSNRAQQGLGICFNELSTYVDSLKYAIKSPYVPYQALGIKVDGEYRQLNGNVLQIENEYYSDIRPKRVTLSGEKPIHALIERGVQYIEVRNTDINPLLPLGIDLTQAHFMDAFLLTCLFSGEDHLSDAECAMLNHNKDRVVKYGRQPDLQLVTTNGEVSRSEVGQAIMNEVAITAKLLDEVNGTDEYSRSVAIQQARLGDTNLTPSSQVLDSLRESGLSYNNWMLMKSREHRQTLGATAISPSRLNELQLKVKTSLAAQSALESQSQEPFDQFLAHYLAG